MKSEKNNFVDNRINAFTKISKWFLISTLIISLTACGSNSLDAPSLDNATAQVYNENETVSTLSFTNNGGKDLTSCTADTLPTGLIVSVSADSSTCEITGTPTTVQSSTTHSVTATNATGSDTATVNIEVKVVVSPLESPALENANSQSYTTELAISKVSFVNTGGEALESCTADSLPVGLTVAVSTDSSTCEITGTPTTAQSATSHTITATNASGNDTATISIIVSEALGATKEWQGVVLAAQSQGGQGQDQHQLVTDKQGNAWVAWKQFDGTNPNKSSIWVNHFNPTTGWGTAENIENLDHDADSPSIAMDASGNVIVVWIYEVSLPIINGNGGGSERQLWGSHLNKNTGTWNSQIQIFEDVNNLYGTRKPSVPKLVMDKNGNALVLWHMRSGTSTGGNELMSSKFSSIDNSWGTSQEVDIAPTATPLLSMNENGQAIAAWTDEDTFVSEGIDVDRVVVKVKLYDMNNGWETTGTLVSLSGDTTTGAFSPQVAINSSGDAMVVWSQDEILPNFKSRTNVLARFYDADTFWSNLVYLETNDSKYGISPQVAMNDEGDAVAIWVHKPEDQASGIKSIWVNHFSQNSGWATALEIESPSAWQNAFPEPQIAMDPDGNAMAVWLQRQNFINDVKATSFDKATNQWDVAQSIGSENDPTSNPQIVIDDLGKVLAIWRTANFGLPDKLQSNYYK